MSNALVNQSHLFESILNSITLQFLELDIIKERLHPTISTYQVSATHQLVSFNLIP